jgi:hypothetical protein
MSEFGGVATAGPLSVSSCEQSATQFANLIVNRGLKLPAETM